MRWNGTKLNVPYCHCCDCILYEIEHGFYKKQGIKKEYIEPKDRHTNRTQQKFLFFPKLINGEYRWLERSEWQECKIVETRGATDWNTGSYQVLWEDTWFPYKWIN